MYGKQNMQCSGRWIASAVYDLSWASAHRKSVSPCGATSRYTAYCGSDLLIIVSPKDAPDDVEHVFSLRSSRSSANIPNQIKNPQAFTWGFSIYKESDDDLLWLWPPRWGLTFKSEC
jgi:hypothetical protein